MGLPRFAWRSHSRSDDQASGAKSKQAIDLLTRLNDFIPENTDGSQIDLFIGLSEAFNLANDPKSATIALERGLTAANMLPEQNLWPLRILVRLDRIDEALDQAGNFDFINLMVSDVYSHDQLDRIWDYVNNDPENLSGKPAITPFVAPAARVDAYTHHRTGFLGF